MAYIYAKFNPTTGSWNPLDPNNWRGGVVPGPDDVARFWYYSTNDSDGYNANNSYMGGYNYIHGTSNHSLKGSNFSSTIRIPRDLFVSSSTHGNTYLTSSYWSGDYTRDVLGRNNAEFSTAGTYLTYGASSNPAYYQRGFYYNQYDTSTIGTRRSRNESTVISWEPLYANKLRTFGAQYGEYYYKGYAYGWKTNWPTAGGTHTFSIHDQNGNNVTISETDTETYGTGNPDYSDNPSYPNNNGAAALPFNYTKERWLAEGNKYPIMERLADLVTGSSLHVSNGGCWEVMTQSGSSCTNGTCVSAMGDHDLNWKKYLVLYTVATQSRGGFTYANSTNTTKYDLSTNCARYSLNTYGTASGWENQQLFTDHHYGPVMEGTASVDGFPMLRYASSSIHSDGVTRVDNVNSNRNRIYWSGSGHWITKLSEYTYTGYGDGTHGNVRLNYGNLMYSNYYESMYLDTSFSNWVDYTSADLDVFPKYNDSNTLTMGTIPCNFAMTQEYNMMQKWELTGSQHWDVGRIQFGRHTHFHVKDSSSITMHDQNTYGYPAIDFQNWGQGGSTFLVTDSVTIDISSSRGSYPGTSDSYNYGGINQYRSQCSLIVSGTANYSQSTNPSTANKGDTSITITDLDDHFGIGDYISIESTGSLRIISNGPQQYRHGLRYTGSNSGVGNSFDSGSLEELMLRHQLVGNSPFNQYSPNPISESIANGNYKTYATTEYTHPIQNDEITQIVSASGNIAYVQKMYGKQGEIQSDMGLYSRNDFISTFDSGGLPSNYTGTKRVVLVDSNHRDFQAGDQLVISGSKICTVLHATTFLSQSHAYEFTSSNQPALDQVFEINPEHASGSSIIPHTLGTYGITNPTYYYTEAFMKHRLLITGSFEGSEFYQDAYKTSNAYNSTRYGGGSGSSNGYRGLRIDPTKLYGWRNWNGTSHYDYHEVVDFGRFSVSDLYLDDTYNFVEGEILISGSMLRDGSFDSTSSLGWFPGSGWTVNWGNINQSGVHNPSPYTYYGRNLSNKYGPRPYPYTHEIQMMHGSGPVIAMNDYNRGNHMSLSDGRVFTGPTASIHSGSFKIYGTGYGGNPAAPYRYLRSAGTKPMQDDSAFPSGLDFDALWMSGSFPYRSATGSFQPGQDIGSNHIKVVLQDGEGDVFVGRGDKDIHYQRIRDQRGRGKIGLGIWGYASIYSINVKTRWQQLILDTQESFNYRDTIAEAGLVNTHTPNKEIKFIATEVVDPKGFKNLLWDQEYTKGTSNIRPYMFAQCYTGTVAGTTEDTVDQSITERNNGRHAFKPNPAGGGGEGNTYGQNNDNYYTIIDFRTPVTFDTIGMRFFPSNAVYYGGEYQVGNMMNNVHFEYCNDVGVDAPNWQQFRAKANDIRKNTNGNDIRFYTNPSGSVTARYVKYHSRGGTSNANYKTYSFMGIYDFSGSCASSNTLDAASVAGGYAEQIGTSTLYSGGPTGSLCQIELANTKNFAVGDIIWFWSKQMDADASIQPQASYNRQRDPQSIGTDYYNHSLPANEMLGGEQGKLYTIIAKSGNIVTLNKPITHTHIGKGTIAYKFNRGKITFRGTRNLPFTIGGSNTYQDKRFQNLTWINGKINYSTTYPDVIPFYMSDVGIYRFKEVQYSNIPGGLLKNVIGNVGQFNNTANVYPQYSNSVKAFNTFNIYRANYPGYINLDNLSWIHNFTVDLGYYNFGYRSVFGDSYDRNDFPVPKVIFTNNYYRGTPYGAVQRLFSEYNAQNDLTDSWADLATIDNNYMSPFYNNPEDENAENPNWKRRLPSDEKIALNAKWRRWNNWYFPGATNIRNRGKFYNDGYNAANKTEENYFDNVSALTIQPFVPRFYKENVAQDRLAGRAHILIRCNSQNAVLATKALDFKTSKFFNFFMQPHLGGLSLTGNSSYGDIRPIICRFTVTETIQARFDIDLIYRLLIFGNKYEDPPTNNQYSNVSYNTPFVNLAFIAIENHTTATFLDVTYLTEIETTTIEKRDIKTLTPGTYSVYIRPRNKHADNSHFLWQMQSMNFRLVTADSSKVVVHNNNWNMLRLFDSEKKPDNDLNPSQQVNQDFHNKSVVKQSSDLGGTTNYKFNKIKL